MSQMPRSKSIQTQRCFLDYCLIWHDAADQGKSVLIGQEGIDTPMVGTIIEIGPGHWDFELGQWRPTRHNPGDRVLYNRHAGYEETICGVTFVKMREVDLLGDDCAEIKFHENCIIFDQYQNLQTENDPRGKGRSF